MEALFSKMLDAILSGGSTGIIALLVMVVVAESWIIKNLLGELNKRDNRVFQIITDYHDGQLKLSQSLESLKNVLLQLRDKL
jgi:hypothetical protein